MKITPREIKGVNVITSPYPGFPTDLQAPFMALMATAKGSSKIKEKVFENRMQHVSQLKKMGASIHLNENVALITGVKKLKGSNVIGGDLRSSAAIVLACISANGNSVFTGLEHLDRGYENLEEKLNNSGASIFRKVRKVSYYQTSSKALVEEENINTNQKAA